MIPVDADIYRTDPASRTWLSWLTPLTRWAFYLPIFEIVYRYGRVASKGRFDDPTWLQSAQEVLRVVEAVGMDVFGTVRNAGLDIKVVTDKESKEVKSYGLLLIE